jgi:DNA-damage-inducible protein D
MTDQLLPTPSANPGTGAFEPIKRTDGDGHEYRLARELATPLGCAKWRQFHEVIKEAMIASASQGYAVQDLCAEAGKKSAGGRPGRDYRLTRMACYMTALSADGNKPEGAAAKTCFAFMTREHEEVLDLAQQLGENPMTVIADRRMERERKQRMTPAIPIMTPGKRRGAG